MPEVENSHLLREVRNLMHNAGVNWENAQGPRSVLYVPFKSSEDQRNQEEIQNKQPSFIQQVQNEKDYLTLRSFGRAVQAKVTENEGGVVTADTLMADYAGLSSNQKMDVLNTTARKSPLIIQHGAVEEGQTFGIRLTDSVNVTGHGADTMGSLSPETGDDPPNLKAREVVVRMKEDLKMDLDGLGKVKLASCGSGGKFMDKFTEAAAQQGLPVDVVVHGYGLDTVGYMDLAFSLDHLDKGNRFVFTDEATEESIKLTAEWREAQGELTGLKSQQARLLGDLRNQAQLVDDLRDDLESLAPEDLVSREAIQDMLTEAEEELQGMKDHLEEHLQPLTEKTTEARQRVDAKHEELADAFFNAAEKASENRKSVSVRDKLKEMGVEVRSGVGGVGQSLK